MRFSFYVNFRVVQIYLLVYSIILRAVKQENLMVSYLCIEEKAPVTNTGTQLVIDYIIYLTTTYLDKLLYAFNKNGEQQTNAHCFPKA